MDYEVRAVSLDDPATLAGAVAVLREAFGEDMTGEKLLLNTTTNASSPSLYMAALKDGEIIGLNGFISHDLLIKGRSVNCYQSCWTATSGLHRGKKIFQNLILGAHEVLRSRGAGFVFGFPNAASHPLFTKKLNYNELPSVKWQAPNLPILWKRWLDTAHFDVATARRDTILQNDRQLIELKRAEYGADILVADHGGSVAWGLRRQVRVKGLNLPILDMGGFDLVAASHLPVLLDQLRRQAGMVAYIQAVSIAGNPLNGMLRGIKPSGSNPLIWFGLNMEVHDLSFGFFNGVRDVFGG